MWNDPRTCISDIRRRIHSDRGHVIQSPLELLHNSDRLNVLFGCPVTLMSTSDIRDLILIRFVGQGVKWDTRYGFMTGATDGGGTDGLFRD